MIVTMTRTVNGKERYYTLQLFPTLFGETLVVRTYGGCANAKPTGTILEYHNSFEEAQSMVQTIQHRKCKGGYTLERH